MKRFRKRVIAGLLTVFLLSSFFTPSTFAIVDGEDEPVSVITDIEEEEILSLMPDEESEEALFSTLAEEPEESTSNITITFVITNPNYTNDPGTNFTHLTSDKVITGGDLSYEEWAGTYKVLGNGIITTISLPTNTSPSQNDLHFPKLSPMNLSGYGVPKNRYTYSSLYSWKTENGLICDKDTVFAENTVLELVLFEEVENYSLDFVCCEEHQSSIKFFASEVGTQIGGSEFPLGACIANENIPLKTTILSVVRYWFEHGTYDWQRKWVEEHEWDNFIGWQLKNTASGQYVPLTPTTPITSDYVNTEYGSSIKVYPKFATLPATATFKNGEATVLTQSLYAGDALGTLPTVTPPTGQVFLGWRVQGETSGFVTAETIINVDTIYVAVFQPEAFYTVTFHDVFGTDDATTTVEDVLVGTRLGTVTDAMLADGVMRSACIWHESNDPNSDTINYSAYTVRGNVDLYTYTYKLVLNYVPPAPVMMKSVVVTSGKNGTKTITITAREGSQLEASDFVIEGVDYRLYQWSYEDDQHVIHTLDIQDLIANGLTGSVTATSDDTPITIDDVTPTPGHTVNFYAFVDGQRMLVETRTIVSYKIWDPNAWSSNGGGNWRYYLLAQTLEDVYADYGFDASDLTVGTRYFPNATKNETTIWADSDVQELNGLAYSALGVRVEEMDVYYLPKQTLTANSGNWSNYRTTESFYSVRVEDPDELVYFEDDLPKTTYTVSGETATVVVSNMSTTEGTQIEWSCVGADETPIIGTVNGSTTTFSIPYIAQPYILTPGVVTDPDPDPEPEYPSMTADEGHTVDFYIFLDNERVLLETRSNVTAYKQEDINRRYLPDVLLEEVYGAYGFDSDDMTAGTRFFPHVDANGSKIWADTPVLAANEHTFSPIYEHGPTNAVDVYYLPHQTLGATSGNWTNYATTDSFYSVRVEDPAGLVYSAGTLPDTTYTLRGGTATATVSNAPADFVWLCTGEDGTPVDGMDNGDGTITFTIQNIDQPYIVEPVPEHGKYISYDINRTRTPVDPEYECPTIMGGDTYTETVEDNAETYTVRAPSQTSYFYLTYKLSNGDLLKHIGEATFLGWAVNGNTAQDALVQPGDVLDLNYPGTISLVAQWGAQHANTDVKTGPMVNFYVSLAAHPLGDSLVWTGDIDQALFTDSVFTDDCGVNAGIVPEKELYTSVIDVGTTGTTKQYFVLGGTSGANVNNNHNLITTSLTNGYTKRGNDGVDYTFQLSFPTDEQVLHRVRQLINQGGDRSEIMVNNHVVTADEMNTDSFSVRWYVFKYDTSDGWHIDGVLVRKPGKIRVTKTFAGDAEAIQAVQENGYSINVALEAGQEGSAHTGKTLTLANADRVNGNTYTWDVPVDLYYNYVVTENNYISSNSLIRTTANYSITNSQSSQNVGWQTYTSGITVTGEDDRENDNENLTVNIKNTYTAPNVLTLRKIDATTGHTMPGVSFTVQDSNGGSITLQNNGNSHYTFSNSGTGTSTIITDSNGQAYLTLPAGTYRLTEVLTWGYFDPGVITVVIGEDTDHNTVLTSATAANGDKFVTTNSEDMSLTVNNHATPLVNLKVKKVWVNEENKPVTLRLYCRNEALRTAITLDGQPDDLEITPWEYVFTDLPLYVDGEPAQYSVREESIDSFSYSPEYPSGYQYYQVHYSDLIYRTALGLTTENIAEATSLELTVTNCRNTGILSIMKVDEFGNPLSGATFHLYQAGETGDGAPTGFGALLKSGTSNANGTVSFGAVNQGEYYLVEYEAPEGYDKLDDVFRLSTVDGVVTMERWNEDTETWERLNNLTVENKRSIVPDTGVLLDSWPYVLILGGVIVGTVFLIIRKRRKRNDD